jgi:hypothetical protein
MACARFARKMEPLSVTASQNKRAGVQSGEPGLPLFPYSRTTWKGNSKKLDFRFTEFSEDEMRRPTLNAVPYGLQTLYGLLRPGRRIGPQ